MPAPSYPAPVLAAELRRGPNVSAVAERLGLGLRGLQRRAARMRLRGIDLPAAGSGRRRWARRPWAQGARLEGRK